MQLRKYFGTLGTIAVTAGLVTGAVMFGGARPAEAIATTYQLPCQPYGNPYYDFAQWVSGWGYHTGEDVCHAAGAPVYATASGLVVYSARTPDSYRWGNLVMIQHDNADGSAVVSLYGHLADNRQVGAGQYINKGQLLGFVGPDYSAANGNWGAHLHFGIHPGAYGSAVGTYAAWIHGYSSTANYDGWTRGSSYIGGRTAAYDYTPMAVTGNTQLSTIGSSQMTFTVRNTGTQTWYAEGHSANPTRLGTVYPNDRGSGFAQNGSGWIDATRISMQADTPPGGTATFQATFKSPLTTGSFNECFSVVVEQVNWISGGPLCAGMQVLPPSYRAQLTQQAVTAPTAAATDFAATTKSSYLLPGQKVNVKFVIKNVGELTWDTSGDNPVRLGTDHARDRGSVFTTANDSRPSAANWLSSSRASAINGKYDPATKTLSPADRILPGEYALFSFTATAPSQPGTYHEYFTPVAEGISWMNDIGMYIPLRVLDTGYHYEWVSQNVTPMTLTGGVTQLTATMRLRNTGRTSWPVGGDLHLGTDRPMEGASPFYTGSGAGAWLSPTRLSSVTRNVTTSSQTTIDSGEVAEFSARLTVPAVPVGSYGVYVRPLMENVAWMPEDYGMFIPVNVTTPPIDSQVVAQIFTAPTAAVAQNSTYVATLAVRNTGRGPWPVSGPHAVKLGTANPMDRASAVAVTTGSDPWLSSSRASGIEGKLYDSLTLSTTPVSQIDPGEIAVFRVPISTVNLGSFKEYFNLVEEGVSWFPDHGVYFPMTVVPSGSVITPTPSPQPSGSPAPALPPVTSWLATGDQFASCIVTGSSYPCTKLTSTKQVSSSWNFKASYATANLVPDTYGLTITYGNVGGAVPAGYHFSVLLRVNGGAAVPLSLPGNASSFTVPNLSLQGPNSISLEWTNDYYVANQYDANWAIGSLTIGK